MAAHEVFVDTSSLYSLLDRSEASHAATARIVARLARMGTKLIVSDYIITETINLANARGGHFVAARVLDLIEQSNGIRLEWIGMTRFDRTKIFFRKHYDHGYSFTDCTSFVLMAELQIAQALTLDRHFIEAGFRVMPE
ncbi:MAG TPA: PIN domain-containing protein [Candidatus Saccharimonadales bacterium]|nr:PIN domain-containing protein [Candidatus Saccharimonadales bacterium]